MKEIQLLSEQFPKIFTQKHFQKLVFATTAWLVVYREQISRKELLRKERLTLLVQKILEVQQQVSVLIGDSIPKRVISSVEWQAYLKRKTTLLQILGENVTISEKEITQKKGQRKIISLVDPEARSGYKTKKKRFTGYKVATTMTIDGFHPSVETLPGNESDMSMALPMVRKVITNAKEVPKTMCLDLGFNSVKNRRALHQLGVQPGIVFVHRLNSRNPGLFSAEDFSFDSQALTVTCPAEQTTIKVTPNAQTETLLFRFPKRLCGDCSLRTNCTTSQTGRTVQFSQHVHLPGILKEKLLDDEFSLNLSLKLLFTDDSWFQTFIPENTIRILGFSPNKNPIFNIISPEEFPRIKEVLNLSNMKLKKKKGWFLKILDNKL